MLRPCGFTALIVSTHSRPKAAARKLVERELRLKVSTHSRPKAAAQVWPAWGAVRWFQLTAARRRLLPSTASTTPFAAVVSTHLSNTFNRLKIHQYNAFRGGGFNSQPPEGGCGPVAKTGAHQKGFNSQPPEGGCNSGHGADVVGVFGFNSQPPEGGCPQIGRA